MDILEILSNDERIIVYTINDARFIYTWNQYDTLQCWRPVVRLRHQDYPSKKFDENDWEEVGILTKSGYGPKSYKAARKAAMEWSKVGGAG